MTLPRSWWKPLEYTECSIGKLSLTPKQLRALKGLGRVNRHTPAGMVGELAKALASHADVPGSDYRNLHELLEDPAVVVLASVEGSVITSISVGCLEQYAPCNDRHIQQGLAFGFMSDHEVDPIQGYIHRMKPLMGIILSVLIDPFKSSGGAIRRQGLGGAHIAAHMVLQGRAGNESVVGFCPAEGDPETTPVYRKILRGFGFETAGRAIFGPINPEKFRQVRGDTLKALGDTPAARAYALRQSLGNVDGKHVFHAMTSDLSAFGLIDDTNYMHHEIPSAERVTA